MIIESIKIKLIRKGAGVAPSYNLSIHGDGKIIYEGVDNVKVKGIFEEPIGEEKVIGLISGLKDSKFFAIEDTFEIDESAGQPYTSLSLTMGSEDGSVKTKTITHYDKDTSVPQELKDFESKIDEVANSKKWVEKPPEPIITEEEKPPSKPIIEKKDKTYKPKKKPVKAIVGVIAIIVVIILLLYMINAGIIVLPSDSNDTPTNGNGDTPTNGNDDNVYDPPMITFISTINQDTSYLLLDIINDSSKPPTTNRFQGGDIVYVYFEFKNITHDKSYSIIEEILLFDSLGASYFDYSIEHSKDNQDNDFYYDSKGVFIESTWPAGEYIFTVKIKDLNTGLNISDTCTIKLLAEDILPPWVEIFVNETSGFSPLSISFNSNIHNFSSYITSYQWDFDDGSSYSYLRNTTHIYTQPGNYYVTFTVNDLSGASASSQIYIEVKELIPGEIVQPEIVEPDSYQEFSVGSVISFKGRATGGSGEYLFEWDFDYHSFEVDDSNQNTSWIYDATGFYIVVLRVTDINDITNIESSDLVIRIV